MIVLCVFAAYLIGSISSSTIVSRQFAHLDIREHGSGNAGATNTLRVLGWKWAVVVLCADIAKGILAVLLAQALGHGTFLYVAMAGLAVIAGHNWPAFFGFRGGKGVATTMGVMVMVLLVPALLAGALSILIVVLSRYVSLGALVFVVLTSLFAFILHYPLSEGIWAGVIALLTIYRHRKNISRLFRGHENKIFAHR
ncbi:glycerol-3-phosphate 1-O-acyltransferase [Alicyclobacillaceae bacterium I2511]|nr:glycerol-3-phosphate 1-O-acyltransferase [Alicyclobacillaceae bacterium I2511]